MEDDLICQNEWVDEPSDQFSADCTFRNPDPAAKAHWEKIVAALPYPMFRVPAQPPMVSVELTGSEEADVRTFLERRKAALAFLPNADE